MKAKPVKLSPGVGYVQCPIEECTHVTIRFASPTGKITLPVIVKGQRKGTGCWTWNGDTEKPTLKPSIKHISGHYEEGHKGSCWCDYNREHPDDPIKFECFLCHSFVNDGQAQFLEDSTHQFRCQTKDMLEVD